MSIIDFYDELALEYHLIYEDWNRAIEHQGVAIDRLIRSRLPDAQSVLDCSCGIGTQALGLASRGYKVLGTDVSERALGRARLEAIHRGLDIVFIACDVRELETLQGTYDVVISCDNALPHLLTDDDVAQAFGRFVPNYCLGGSWSLPSATTTRRWSSGQSLSLPESIQDRRAKWWSACMTGMHQTVPCTRSIF